MATYDAREQADIQPVRDNDHGDPARVAMEAAYAATSDGFFAGWHEQRRYEVKEVIGRGSYGVVCAAIDNYTKERVAIKKIQNVFDNVADATRILREIKLLRLLKHPDVVEIRNIMLPPDPRSYKDLYVVFELLESDLHTVIGANDDLTQDHHKVFLYQLLCGMNYIHRSGVLHRDLKPKNILANSNCKLKICDFGLARPFLTNTSVSPVGWTDYVATRWYRAPELCGCFYGHYTQAVDVWSIGCIFAEVLGGRPLFPGRDAVSQLQLITDLLGKPSQDTINRIANEKARAFLNAMPAKQARPLSQKFPSASPAAIALLQRLLSFDPAERPSADQALADPYFANLPNAQHQEPAKYGPHVFEFERRKLETADVRALIYQEALHYHPDVAQYLAKQHAALPVYTMPALNNPGGDWMMRMQFHKKMAEAQNHPGGSMAQQAVSASLAMQQLQQQATAHTTDYNSMALMYKQQQMAAQMYSQEMVLSAEQQQMVYQQVLHQQRYVASMQAQAVREPGR